MDVEGCVPGGGDEELLGGVVGDAFDGFAVAGEGGFAAVCEVDSVVFVLDLVMRPLLVNSLTCRLRTRHPRRRLRRHSLQSMYQVAPRRTLLTSP